jgi:hypothetical protein
VIAARRSHDRHRSSTERAKPVPWPIADPERLDELRAAAGIEPFTVNAVRYP